MDLAQQLVAASDNGAHLIRSGTCVTLGTFDGVHRGHQALLGSLKLHADTQALQPVALVFRNPPRSIINPSRRTPLLCDLDERMNLIRNQGINHAFAIDFNDQLRNMAANEFLNQLRELLGLKCLMLGEGAKVGHDQRTLSDLSASAQSRERTEFVSVPTASRGGAPISSSCIRQALSKGDVATAREMLGRPFHRYGMVEPGQGRATDLGIPTANLTWSRETSMPAPGIYASWTTIGDGSIWPSATYIGDNPTLGGASNALETHLLGFDSRPRRALYGQTINISFVQFMRHDTEFKSIDYLAAQLKADIAQITELLQQSEPLGYPIPQAIQ